MVARTRPLRAKRGDEKVQVAYHSKENQYALPTSIDPPRDDEIGKR